MDLLSDCTYNPCLVTVNALLWGCSFSLLVWIVWFVSKRFANEIIKWLDYQSNISKSLIIKSIDDQFQLSVWLSKVLIIKSKNPRIKSIRVGKKAWYVPLMQRITTAKFKKNRASLKCDLRCGSSLTPDLGVWGAQISVCCLSVCRC